MSLSPHDVYVPFAAEIVERKEESEDIFTLALKFIDKSLQKDYYFCPGQFNMLYLFGVGEVAISVVSSVEETHTYVHTIRRVGRVTSGLAQLKVGDHVGVRGPFGRGWPLEKIHNKDVLIVTGGLGCAPSVSIIDYLLKKRDDFGELIILQGVKHSDDLIFRKKYEYWASLPKTQVKLAADVSQPGWPGYTGLVTTLIDQVDLDPTNTLVFMCGPEGMMLAATNSLLASKVKEDQIYLSLERNMECAVGQCGHCQFGGEFVCKTGPVFCYPKVKQLLGKKGF